MIIFSVVIFFLLSFKSYNSEIIMSCRITNELEDNQETSNRIYEDKKLEIYLDKNKLWLYDIKYNDWIKKNIENKEKVETYFREHKKSYHFELKKYDDSEKNILESRSKIIFEKIGGYLEFKKFYYNYNQKLFFSSEVKGVCTQK